MISILMIPLVMNLNISFLQTQTDAKYEQASSESESITRIFRRMLTESSSKGFEISDLTYLADDLEAQFPQTTIEVISDPDPDAEVPINIIVTSTSGVGNSSKVKVTHLPILILPPRHSGGGEGGGGGSSPTENSIGTEFYHTHAVVMNNSAYNSIFYVCGDPNKVEQPSEAFYEDNFDKAQFQEDFSNYINYYTGANFTKRYNVGGLVIDSISTTINKPSRTIVAPNGNITGVIQHAGHVSVTETWKSFNIVPPSGSENAIEAYGNLLFPDYVNGTTSKVTGDIRVGGNLITKGAETLTINGDVFIRGNWVINNSITHLIINGNLYVGGGMGTNESNMPYITKLSVTGDVIFGGNMNFNLANMDVGGSLLSGGNIDFTNTATLVEIDGDVIAKGNITFQAITDVRIGGAVAANGNVLFKNTIANVTIGGDLVATGNISFESINTTFLIGGIIGSYNNVSFNNNINTDESKIGGFYAGGTATFPSWFDEGENNKICIEYATPDSGTNTKIEFGV
jgi:hypothetical protein